VDLVAPPLGFLVAFFPFSAISEANVGRPQIGTHTYACVSVAITSVAVADTPRLALQGQVDADDRALGLESKASVWIDDDIGGANMVAYLEIALGDRTELDVERAEMAMY